MGPWLQALELTRRRRRATCLVCRLPSRPKARVAAPFYHVAGRMQSRESWLEPRHRLAGSSLRRSIAWLCAKHGRYTACTRARRLTSGARTHTACLSRSRACARCHAGCCLRVCPPRAYSGLGPEHRCWYIYANALRAGARALRPAPLSVSGAGGLQLDSRRACERTLDCHRKGLAARGQPPFSSCCVAQVGLINFPSGDRMADNIRDWGPQSPIYVTANLLCVVF